MSARASAGWLVVLCALALALASSAAAQDERPKGTVPKTPPSQRTRQLSAGQIDALLTRAEKLLSKGQALQAIRIVQPADAALFTDEGMSFARYDELSGRTYSVAWTAVVRLRGSHDAQGKPTRERRATLIQAESQLRGILTANDPTWSARHAEALVALGDRMAEAYAVLHALHEAGALLEPEGYAALAAAAAASAVPEVAQAARAQCVALAKRRSAHVCGK